MTSAESAILMGFPSDWRLPHGSRVSQKAVGNALCVDMSKAIMVAAMKVMNDSNTPNTVRASPQPTHTTNKRSNDDTDNNTHTESHSTSLGDDIHKILKRLKRMERALLTSPEASSVEGPPHSDPDVGPQGCS